MSREPPRSRNGNNQGRKDMLDFWMMTEMVRLLLFTYQREFVVFWCVCVWRNGEALAKVGVIYQMKILPKICFQNRLPIQIDAYFYYYAVVAYLRY